ncbi:MAG: HIT family protein [Pseudomonadota bacterium]
MNPTFEKFGWPHTKIVELDHWAALLRPEQPTVGSLVLACKQPVKAFAEVDAAGFAELQHAVAGIEALLKGAISYEKINYLMLMMVDPDVHFHVIPRYQGTRTLLDIEVEDTGWPGPPVLAGARALTRPEMDALVADLSGRWQH